jgi:hypothetical protein
MRTSRYTALIVATCLLAPAPARAGDEPMLGSKDSFWGSLGLQYRLRVEVRDSADLTFDERDTLLVGLQRARLHLDFSYADWAQAFVQLQDSRALGYGNSSVQYDGNTDLHQAWARFTIGKIFSIKAGRQMLLYGDQRLVGALEWSNVGRTFDGLRLWVDYGTGQLDAFATVFTPDARGDLTKGTWFIGLYDSIRFLDDAITWDQYVMGLFDTPGAMPAGTLIDPENPTPGPERSLVTLGTRLALALGGVSMGVEGAYQTGYHYGGFGNEDVAVDQHAYAVHGDLAYTIDVATRPFIRFEINHASGNGTDSDRHWRRFDNLFPTNHGHYGFMDLAGWSSTLNGAVGFGLSPHRIVSLAVSYWILARGSKHDGWFSAGGAELAPAPDPASPSRHDDSLMLGHELDLTIDLAINRHVRIHNGFGSFVPQGYARVRGPDIQLWAYSMMIVGF